MRFEIASVDLIRDHLGVRRALASALYDALVNTRIVDSASATIDKVNARALLRSLCGPRNLYLPYVPAMERVEVGNDGEAR